MRVVRHVRQALHFVSSVGVYLWRRCFQSSTPTVEIGNVIGEGTYGTVFCAVFKGKRVAVKVARAIETERVISQESELLQSIEAHKHVVSVVLTTTVNGLAAFILDFAETDMFAVVEKQKLSESNAISYFNEMVEAVNHVHGHDIAHLDIKLENWLLVKGVIKLSDFNLSKRIERNTWIQTKCGSYSYCAPEILRGRPYDAFVADVWSMGVCLFTMLCGFFPFVRADKSDWRFNTYFGKVDCIMTSLFELYKLKCDITPSVRLKVHGMLLSPQQRIHLESFSTPDEVGITIPDTPPRLWRTGNRYEILNDTPPTKGESLPSSAV